MLQKLATLLKIRSDEGRLVLLVALLFACIQAGQGMGDNAASALFLLRYGVEFLPYMYIAAGALTFVLTMAYSAGLSRFARGRFFLWMIAVSASLLVVERAAILSSFSFLYPALWLTINSMAMILGTLVWNVAGEVCDARQAKRLFPLFTSAGILGSVVGNAVTGLAARILGTDNLLLLYAALLGGAFYLTRAIALSHFRKDKPSKEKSNLLSDLRSGFDFVRSSALMRLIAYSSILFSVLFFAIAFPFSRVVSDSFPDEAAVAGFFGLFNSITTAATFLVSLFLANRIYTRLGIINGVFIMPLTYILCFGVFAASYDLIGAGSARFAQLVILGGIAGTAWNALFNVVPSQKRGQVLAFNNGVPSQVGVALSGILLLVADRLFTPQQILLVGASIALVCGAFIWRMRTAYARALVEALRAGRLEVFTANEGTFSGFQGDAAGHQVVTEALIDSKATTRRLAAEILGRMGSDSAIPALTARLSDPDAGVRVAVLRAIGGLSAESALEAVAAGLDDLDPQVRWQTLKTLAKLGPKPSTELQKKMTGLLDDESISVRTQAALTLAQLGFGEWVMPSLMLWLYAKDQQIRVAAIETIGHSVPYLKVPLDVKSLLGALEDPSPAIRRAAAGALVNFPEQTVSQALVGLLRDTDESVRSAAAEVLRMRGDESRPLVLDLIESDGSTIDAALEALSPGKPETLAPLRSFAQREILHARSLRDQRASLLPGGSAVNFLRERLRLQAMMCEGRLIRTVGLFGDMGTMELVRKSMNGTDLENRAAALEALDTIGDRQLAKGIISLLEGEPVPSDPCLVIESLIRGDDLWLRILGICSAPELDYRVLIPLLHELKSDPEALVREAALYSLSKLGEEKPMDTLRTVSIVQRILLLREIPIFADLSPEDLNRVAELAREEWYPQDAVIFQQGEEGNRMFVIVEGQVKVMKKADGGEQALAQRGPGDFVGEMAIIESAPRSATLRTQTEVRLLAIDDETFKGILRERPDVSLAILRSLSRRLREMSV